MGGGGGGGGDNGNTARAPSKWSTVFHIHCVQGRRHVARKQFKNCSQQMDPLDAIIYSFKTMVVMCTRALGYFSLDVLFKKTKHVSVFSVSATAKEPLVWRRHRFHGSTHIVSHTLAFTRQWRPPARCLGIFCCDLFWSKSTSLHDTAHFSILTSPPPSLLWILSFFFLTSLLPHFFHCYAVGMLSVIS